MRFYLENFTNLANCIICTETIDLCATRQNLKYNVSMIKLIKYVIFIILSSLVMVTTLELDNSDSSITTINMTQKMQEKDYVKKYCTGIIEYTLPDKTRIDCLTEEYAIEFDYAKKWAESIGQSLYYAKKTGKKPAVAIITEGEKDLKYINRIKETDENITIFEIPAVNISDKNVLIPSYTLSLN